MIAQAILATIIVLTVIITARLLERKWPIDPNLPHSEVMRDWAASCLSLALTLLFSPLMLPCSAAIVTMAGGGFIKLPTDGWGYAASLVGVVLGLDLYRYCQHRLQHAVPFLWAMHSFHHSATALTLITGARHLWLEKVILGAFFPVLPILVAVPPDMATIASIILFLPDGCAHLNVRFPMGRAITWVSSPQWHRIHHSLLPEHWNKNFAGALPLWDILFGTAWIPRANEYPPTGLSPDGTASLLDSIIWPFRHCLGRLLRGGRRSAMQT